VRQRKEINDCDFLQRRNKKGGSCGENKQLQKLGRGGLSLRSAMREGAIKGFQAEGANEEVHREKD